MVDARNTEEWRDVAGWAGVYRVSSHGRIRRLPRYVASKNGSFALRKGGDTFGSKTHKGYREIQMTADGRLERRFVHQIVCDTFNGLRSDPDHQVRHLDGNPNNNHASNLAWGTAKENSADQVLHGTDPVGERAGNSRLTEAEVLDIRRLYRREYGMLSKLASTFGVTPTQILNIVNRRQWAHI